MFPPYLERIDNPLEVIDLNRRFFGRNVDEFMTRIVIEKFGLNINKQIYSTSTS